MAQVCDCEERFNHKSLATAYKAYYMLIYFCFPMGRNPKQVFNAVFLTCSWINPSRRDLSCV